MRIRWPDYVLLSLCMMVSCAGAGADEHLAPILNAPPRLDLSPQPPAIGSGLRGGAAVGGDLQLAPIVNAIALPDNTAQSTGGDWYTGADIGSDLQLAPIVNATALPDNTAQSTGGDWYTGADIGSDLQLAPIVNATALPYRVPRPLAGGSGLPGSTASSGQVHLVSQQDLSILSDGTMAEKNGGDENGDESWTDDDTENTGQTSCGAVQCATECRGALDCSCAACSQRSYFAFGEFTFLRARNAGISYGVPIDGPIEDPPLTSPIQVGSVGIVDPDYQTGFRVGMGVELDSSSMVLGRFWQFRSNTSDQIETEDPNVIRSLVSHPSSASAATDFLQASARYDIDFDLVDLDFQYLWGSSCDFAVNYFVGARYTNLEQEFVATFVNTGVEQVATDIGFDGGGVRLGLEGLRFAGARGLHVYGRGAASFVGGQFRARYVQGQSFDPVVVDTSWQSGRVVTMLDFEAGLGWQTSGGGMRFTAGYAFSAWFNAVTTDDLIKAVQTNNFTGLDSTLSFDGLTTAVELRF